MILSFLLTVIIMHIVKNVQYAKQKQLVSVKKMLPIKVESLHAITEYNC